MNFRTFTGGGSRSPPPQQAEAFETYIEQDEYLSAHRGQYAERGAVFLPLLHKLDLSVTQDIFKNIKGKRNAGQFRIDIQNFGNLLNSNWGVGQRVIRNNILTTPAVDAARPPRLPHAGGEQPAGARTYESTSGIRRLPVHAQLPVFVQLEDLRAWDLGPGPEIQGAGQNDPPFFL